MLFAIVLLVEGAVLFTSSSGIALLLIVYPLFIAHALPQRILRVLRNRRSIPVLAAFATGIWAADLVTD